MKTEEIQDVQAEVITEKTIDKQKLHFRIEEALKQYLKNKEIVRDINEQNKFLKEQIEQDFELLEATELITELQNGDYGKVFKKPRIKEKLDKDALAEHLKISVDELKTPWDFTKLAEKYLEEFEKKEREETLSQLVSMYTKEETIIQTKISRLKKKPKNKKEN